MFIRPIAGAASHVRELPVSNHDISILLLGADSHLGRAFEQSAPAGARIHRVSRKAANANGARTTHVVSDYTVLEDTIFSGIDVIVNCVGSIDGATDDVLQRPNVTVPVHLAQAARRAGVPTLIHVSSLSVYGRQPLIDHNTAVNPVDAYGRSKARADAALVLLSDEALVITLVRMPVVYGQNRTNKIARLAALVMRLGWFVGPMDEPQRSVLHIEQAARALWHLAVQPQRGVVLLADPEAFRLSVFCDVIASRTGRRIRLVRLPSWVLASLKWAMPSLHASLFTSSLIASEANRLPSLFLPNSLWDGIGHQLDLITAK